MQEPQEVAEKLQHQLTQSQEHQAAVTAQLQTQDAQDAEHVAAQECVPKSEEGGSQEVSSAQTRMMRLCATCTYEVSTIACSSMYFTCICQCKMPATSSIAS